MPVHEGIETVERVNLDIAFVQPERELVHVAEQVRIGHRITHVRITAMNTATSRPNETMMTVVSAER